MKTVLILGGTSDVGMATARVYARRGWRIILAGRNRAELERNQRDIEARYGGSASCLLFDALESGKSLLEGAHPLPDTVVSVVGFLGEQTRAQQDTVHASKIIRTNFEAPALLLEELAAGMASRGSGTLVGVGSVAGDRGRASNYIYGAAKAGFAAFLSGLRSRLTGNGVHVMTVKPGFIRTRMTAGMALPSLITATPEEVGEAIYRGAEIRKSDVIYVRPIWALIMAVIRNIPERQFKKLKL